MNHAVLYLKSVFGFLGVTDIETIYVEGLAFGPEAAEKGDRCRQGRAEELALAT
ncbi:NAD(P)H-dependent oxidoreductase [Rhizobium giardinii]